MLGSDKPTVEGSVDAGFFFFFGFSFWIVLEIVSIVVAIVSFFVVPLFRLFVFFCVLFRIVSSCLEHYHCHLWADGVT